jgi:microcystin degradation protein MlrC
MPRLAVLRFAHEGNSFNPVVTGRPDFAREGWFTGEAARAAYRGTRSELGAVVDFLDARSEWQGVFLRCASAPPGGPVADDLIAAVIAEVSQGLALQGPWDGVFVSLHGAMIGERRLAPDLDLLRAVRSAVGPACAVAASFDLHANMATAIGEAADIVVGYKTYPHLDMFETAAKALGLLARALHGEIVPRSLIHSAAAVLPSHNMRTAAGPMAEIEALAAELAERDGLLDVTPFGGFAYADVPQAGASAAVCYNARRLDGAAAATTARALAEAIRQRRAAFRPELPTAADGLRRALAEARYGPVAVLEPADNPLSGGTGDAPGLFRALLEARPEGPCVFAFFCDPRLAKQAGAAGRGALLGPGLGGRLTAAFGPPVAVTARVERLTDGRFVNDGPMWTGHKVDLGATAVLRVVDAPELWVIVTSAAVAPNDPAYFRLHGIEPAEARLLCVKAKNHFRAAFAGSFRAIIDVDTPGPATVDLDALPFTRVPKERLSLSP